MRERLIGHNQHAAVGVRAAHRRWRTPLAALFFGAAALQGCVPSTQEEVAIGAQYAAQINQELPIVTDPEITRYINVLGDSIARVADQRNLDWHFYVVDQQEVNAFAVPGGYIYVNRGLIERAETMSELAGVLGHEIGHVTERHSMEQMAKAQQANVGLGIGCILAPQVCNSGLGATAIQLGAGGAFAKFSRDDESEADRVGIQFVVRAGIDPRGIPGDVPDAARGAPAPPRRARGDVLHAPARRGSRRGVGGDHQPDRSGDPPVAHHRYTGVPAFKARLQSLPPSPQSGAR